MGLSHEPVPHRGRARGRGVLSATVRALRRSAAALAVAPAFALLSVACGDDGSDPNGVEAAPDAPHAPVSSATAKGTPNDPDAGDGRLELAVLPALPEFVAPDGRAARSPQPGHVASHGALDDLARPRAGEDGPLVLTWIQLDASGYEEPALFAEGSRPPLAEVLDAEVLAADGRRVAVDGFATVEEDDAAGGVTRLVLTPLPPACCLGRFPDASERVHVRVPAELGLALDPFEPLRLVGTLAVEERRDGLGLFEGLYFLEVEGLEVDGLEVEGLEVDGPDVDGLAPRRPR